MTCTLPPLMTIREFTSAMRISRATLYRLGDKSQGPQRVKLHKCGAVRIVRDCIWIASVLGRSGAKCDGCPFRQPPESA